MALFSFAVWFFCTAFLSMKKGEQATSDAGNDIRALKATQATLRAPDANVLEKRAPRHQINEIPTTIGRTTTPDSQRRIENDALLALPACGNLPSALNLIAEGHNAACLHPQRASLTAWPSVETLQPKPLLVANLTVEFMVSGRVKMWLLLTPPPAPPSPYTHLSRAH
jgi:hypothetical protein